MRIILTLAASLAPILGFGEAFAAGIFLGAGLIHMLCDSQATFDAGRVAYPYPMVICGAVMLLLLWVEHWANQAIEHPSANSRLLPLTAVLMLSIHSLLMGAAFGISTSIALTIVLFIAVLAHRGSASFDLDLELGRSSFSTISAWRVFLVFVAMFPLGALLGQGVSTAADARGLMGRKHSSKSSPAIFALLKSLIGLMFCQVAGMVNGKWALMDNTRNASL